MKRTKVRFRSSMLAALVVISVVGGTLAFVGAASAAGDEISSVSDVSSVDQVETETPINETETADGEMETETETPTPGDHVYPGEDETVTTSPGVETTPSGDTTETTTGQDAPGFGIIVALVALVAATVLVVRREN